MSTEHIETRRETEAALAARRELGADYEDAIAASLADRVEHLAVLRAGRLMQSAEAVGQEDARERSARTQSFVLGIISLAAGIPITAIGASEVHPGVVGVLVSWAGIVGINVAFSRSNRGHRSDRTDRRDR